LRDLGVERLVWTEFKNAALVGAEFDAFVSEGEVGTEGEDEGDAGCFHWMMDY
jgi:hypothetical protein